MTMNAKIAYKILGLSSTSTRDEIVKKYRELAKLHHPDANNSGSDSDKFEKIAKAYNFIIPLKPRDIIHQKQFETERRDKHKAFQRLAQARLEQTINEIRKIGNLSNEYNYFYTEEEVEQLFASLEKSIRETRKKFSC